MHPPKLGPKETCPIKARQDRKDRALHQLWVWVITWFLIILGLVLGNHACH